jgi:hypothetical protein
LEFFPTFLWCFGGVMAGTIAVTLVSRWFRTLAGALGIAQPGVSRPALSERRVVWVLTIINPVPWAVLIGVPYGIYYFSLHPLTGGRRWFIGGAVVAFLGLYLLTALAVFRARRRLTEGQSEKPDSVA